MTPQEYIRLFAMMSAVNAAISFMKTCNAGTFGKRLLNLVCFVAYLVLAKVGFDLS